jgi:ferric-dicitrate binding protein FerR (iron transport regulator)
LPAPDRKKDSNIRWWTIIIPLSTVRFWITFGFVLLVLAGLFAAAWYQYLGPRGQSRRLIAQAEQMFDRAIVAGVKDLSFEQFKTAQDDLFQAKKNYDGRKWTAARLMAEEAVSVLGKAMEGMRSDKYFVKERKAAVTFAGGAVEVQRAGSLGWEAVRAGDALRKGDRLRTRSGGSLSLVFDDGSQLTVKSNSLVLIEELTEDMRTRQKNSSIRLLESDVEADILRPTARGSRFLIETPTAVAQVDRARMSVRVGKGRTEFSLQTGEVTVKSGGREIALGENENLEVNAKGQAMRGRTMAAPLLLRPATLAWTLSRAEKEPVDFSWSPVPSAKSYRLTVAGDRFFSNHAFPPALVSSAAFRSPPLPSGLYYWRVAAVDRAGREGMPGPFRVFRLVRDERPPVLEFAAPIVLAEKSGARAYVSGAAEPGTRLTLNGAVAPQGRDGSFAVFVPLPALPSVIRVSALDAAGNSLEQKLEVR